ncbi:MAG: hypothetical protein HYY84_16785 [Deltaproteobacteria bacterium]|nr:hypothetical protein [Deltaproteobacteria bacterium]
MKRELIIPGVAILLAALSSLLDRDRAWEPARVGDFVALEGDIHTHSIVAAAFPTPVDLALLARRQKLDFIAVVEHQSLAGAPLTAAIARRLAPEVVVIPSEEITTKRYHLLAIGLTRSIDAARPMGDVIAEIRKQGGVAVAAHPTRKTWPLFHEKVDLGMLDGVEVMHPVRAFTSRPGSSFRGEDIAQFWIDASARTKRPLAALGGSDFHALSMMGFCRSIVLAREKSQVAILDAIRAGRSVAACHGMPLEGNPEWLDLLSRSGYLPRPSRHSYATASASAQAIAWILVLFLVSSLFWRRAAP